MRNQKWIAKETERREKNGERRRKMQRRNDAEETLLISMHTRIVFTKIFYFSFSLVFAEKQKNFEWNWNERNVSNQLANNQIGKLKENVQKRSLA